MTSINKIATMVAAACCCLGVLIGIILIAISFKSMDENQVRRHCPALRLCHEPLTGCQTGCHWLACVPTVS